jgi:hypothetical protein
MKTNDDNDLESHVPTEGVVDDTNTMEGQLVSAGATAHMSRHLAMQIQKYLTGITYPADKAALYDYAMTKGADQALLNSLKRMQSKSYQSAEALHNEMLRSVKL